MKAKFIIVTVIALTVVTAIFLTQQEPANEAPEIKADIPLDSDSPITQREAPEETTNKKIDSGVSVSNKAPVSKARRNEGTSRGDYLEEQYRLVSNNEDYPTLASRINAIKDRRPNLNIPAEAVLAALEKSESWEATQGPLAKVKSKLSEVELSDGRSFLEFDRIKVETLMPGDHMYIPIDDLGTAYDMRIDEVEDFSDGNLMWKGSLINVEGTEAEGGTVTITQSSNITVASIVLRETDYTLESFGSEGWIADSAILFKNEQGRETDAVTPASEQ